MKFFPYVLAAVLLMTPLHALGGNVVDRARVITGFDYGRSALADIKVKEWEPLAESNRDYVGFVSGPGKTSYAVNVGEKEPKISSRHQLERLVQGMSALLREEQPVKLHGLTIEKLASWLEEINTGIVGNVHAQKRGRHAVLKASYPSTTRIFAAFRNPDVEPRLDAREKQVLETCAQWICDNIQLGMPYEVALKKAHDALLDGTVYTKGRHGVDDVILDGAGSCVGYAAATQLLLSMLGIECRQVSGTAEMNHVWNLVRMDKKWYHLDTAWNDPIGGSGRRMYTYYLLTDAEVASDHEWQKPELYPRSQGFNDWHFYMRNDVRQSWRTSPGFSQPPKEDDSILRIMFDGQASESMAQKSQSRSQSEAAKKGRASEPDNKAFRCLSSTDIDRALESRLAELDETTIKLICETDIPAWQMRRMVAESALPQYASRYSVVYDDEKKHIHINLRFWVHRRLVAAEKEPAIAEKLNQAEKKALEQCCRWADTYGTPWKTDRQKVRDAYIALIEHFSPTRNLREIDAVISGRKCGSMAYAQAMYVVCHIMKVKCRMVHGRTEKGTHVWNMVQLNKSKWLHVDATTDDVPGRVSEHQCDFLLRTDEQMRPSHAWNAAEFSPAGSPLPAQKQ